MLHKSVIMHCCNLFKYSVICVRVCVQSSVNARKNVLLSVKCYASLFIYLVKKNGCGYNILYLMCCYLFRSLIHYCKTGYNQGVKYFFVHPLMGSQTN